MEIVKEYVQVLACFDEEGRITPRVIKYRDRRFPIDAVLEAVPAASLRAGGAGMRYRIRIAGKETYLFDEEGRWFVEAKN